MAVAMLVCFASYAQMGRPSFGLRAGVNFQNLNGKDANDDKLENKLKLGFNVGVNAEIPVAHEFYVQPGVLYTTKGAKLDDNGGNDAKVNIGYIEIPINLLYKPALGQGSLLMGFGPYVAFGINGQYKSDLGDADINFANEVNASNFGDFTIKRFDAGANLLFGYEINRQLSAQLNAQLGLLNLAPELSGAGNTDLGTIKNTGFGVSLGYRF